MKQFFCYRNVFFIVVIFKVIIFVVNYVVLKIKFCNIFSLDYIIVNFSISCVSNEVYGFLFVLFIGI